MCLAIASQTIYHSVKWTGRAYGVERGYESEYAKMASDFELPAELLNRQLELDTKCQDMAKKFHNIRMDRGDSNGLVSFMVRVCMLWGLDHKNNLMNNLGNIDFLERID
jgi:hypothetical protein